MIIKIEDSLGQIPQKNTIECLNIHFGRLCYHQEIQSTDCIFFISNLDNFVAILILILAHLGNIQNSREVLTTI
jgi:hypothetical protein